MREQPFRLLRLLLVFERGGDGPFFDVRLCGLFAGGEFRGGRFHASLGGIAQFLLVIGNHIHHRWRITTAGLFAAVGVVVKKCKELIILLVGNGIVFMAVALGAFHAEAEPDIAGGFHAIHHIFHAVFLDDEATLVGGAVVAIKSGCHFLRHRGVGQQVAGNLFDGKIFEGLVGVVSINHPIAPGPHCARAVGVMHAAVTVAGDIHPMQRHSLGVCLGGKQAVDDFFVCLRALVIHECHYLEQRGRQAGEVKRDATNEDCFRRLRRRL